MDVGPALVIGLMWLVVNAIRKAGSKPPGPPAPRPPVSPPRSGPALPRSGRQPLPGTRPASLPPRAGTDATQQEGSRLEALLRELGRTLDQASGPAGRPPDRRLPSAEDVEERRSLEVAPEVQSLETDAPRPGRAVVDFDDEAAQLIAKRLAAAEAHAGPLGKAEHAAFEARIRQQPADKTATRGYTVQQLRDAMVWREILGPPVSLRTEDDRP